MSGTKNKLQLNSTARKLLFQHSIRTIEEKRKKSSNFLKFLITSQGFLITSQRNDLYTLVLENIWFKSVNFSIFKKYYGDYNSNLNMMISFDLTANEARSLMHLLKPRNFDVYFRFKLENLGEYSKLIDDFNGKIGLFTTDGDLPSILPRISQIVKLKCNTVNFLDTNSSMNLEYLEVDCMTLKLLANLLSKHRIQKIKTSIAPPDYFRESYPSNNVLKEFELEYDDQVEEFMPILHGILSICTALKRILVTISNTENAYNQIVPLIQNISEYYRLFQKLDVECEKKHPNIEFFEIRCVCTCWKPNNNWMKAIKHAIDENKNDEDEDDLFEMDYDLDERYEEEKYDSIELNSRNGKFIFSILLDNADNY